MLADATELILGDAVSLTVCDGTLDGDPLSDTDAVGVDDDPCDTDAVGDPLAVPLVDGEDPSDTDADGDDDGAPVLLADATDVTVGVRVAVADADTALVTDADAEGTLLALSCSVDDALGAAGVPDDDATLEGE